MVFSLIRCVSCSNRWVDPKEQEVKQELLVIEEVSVTQIEGFNYQVEEGLLVKEVVVASLFLVFEQNKK